MPVRAVIKLADHDESPAFDSAGMLSEPEHHMQEKTADEAEKRLATLNVAMNAASFSLFEALGYPVVDHRLRLRPPRPLPEVMPVCVGALLELSALLSR